MTRINAVNLAAAFAASPPFAMAPSRSRVPAKSRKGSTFSFLSTVYRPRSLDSIPEVLLHFSPFPYLDRSLKARDSGSFSLYAAAIALGPDRRGASEEASLSQVQKHGKSLPRPTFPHHDTTH